MLQITNGSHLLLPQIDKRDLDDRMLLVRGYNQGELFPPYEDGISERYVKPIHKHIANFDKEKILYDFPEENDALPKIVEIAGAWMSSCVVGSFLHALDIGKDALLNLDMILEFDSTTQQEKHDYFVDMLEHDGEIDLSKIAANRYGPEFLFYQLNSSKKPQ